MYEEIKEKYQEIPLGKATNLKGKKFGKLTPLYRTTSPTKTTYWVCKCDCGNPESIKPYDAASLVSGRTKSCGCLKKSDAKEKTNLLMIGKKIGHWTILSRDNNTEGTHIKWICECDCDNHTINSLRTDEMKNSLGCNLCSTKKNKFIDLTNKKFGHWTVLFRAPNQKGHTMWHCQCDCENKTERDIDSYKLRNGISLSCGCATRSKGEQKIIQILKQNNILFEEQKQFDSCKTSLEGYAKFDFYVQNKYLIEYDGSQHFILASNKGWNSEDNLRRTQERDRIKDQWCKENNIPLIRIPYTHYNDLCIEDLLLETSKFII